MKPLSEDEREEKIEEIWDNFKTWQNAPQEDNQGEMKVEVEKLKVLWGIHESLQDLYLLIADRL